MGDTRFNTKREISIDPAAAFFSLSSKSKLKKRLKSNNFCFSRRLIRIHIWSFFPRHRLVYVS